MNLRVTSLSAASQPAAAPPANFDSVAHPYRWMEYLTFGPFLWRCRTHFLPRLHGHRSALRHALVLGDGDGRFTAALLSAQPQLHADAVDASAAMLHLLTQRTHASTPNAAHLRTHHSDALTFVSSLPADTSYDLLVTHFFLDCLTQHELESLTQALAPHLEPGALWLLSDFRIPTSPMRLPARLLVRALYLTFRLLTGLRTTHLPDHAAALTSAGLTRVAQHTSFFGILATELWAHFIPLTGVHSTPCSSRNSAHTNKNQPIHSPDPEPPSPSLPTPDPDVFHPAPLAPATSN